MIRKTDKYFKRRDQVWALGMPTDVSVTEYVRRETWWLLGVIPLYSRDTVIDNPR